MQIHGYGYHHARGGIYRRGDLPVWAREVALQLRRDGLMPGVADQAIVNEYEPGSGIPMHVDAACFDGTIVSLSLCSTCVIAFSDERSGRHEELLLEPRSALVMSLEARHEWKHGIPDRLSDGWEGRELPRRRRLSLTFRTMLVGSGYGPAPAGGLSRRPDRGGAA